MPTKLTPADVLANVEDDEDRSPFMRWLKKDPDIEKLFWETLDLYYFSGEMSFAPLFRGFQKLHPEAPDVTPAGVKRLVDRMRRAETG